MNNTIKHMREAKSSANCTSWGNKIVSVVLSAILLGFGWPAVNPAEVYAEDGAASGGGGAPSFLATLQTLRRRWVGETMLPLARAANPWEFLLLRLGA